MNLTVDMRKSSRQELITACTQFFINELKLNSSRYTLIVTSQVGLLRTMGFNGGISQTGPKEITIVLDSRLPLEQLAVTLAHEMVHAKQFAKGRLQTYMQGDTLINVWQGKVIDLPYYNRPWEREAWRQERDLACRLFALTA